MTAAITFVLGILFFSIELIAGMVFFNATDNILGFSKMDYLLLITTANTITFLYQTLAISSHENLVDTILDGKLDYVLLRPVDSMMYYSLYIMDIPSLLNLFVALILLKYFLSFYSLQILQVVLFLISIILATALLFILNHLAVCISFWKDNALSILGIPEYLMEFSSRPYSIYPSPLRFIFTWIVPILKSVNLPVLIIKGEKFEIHLIFLFVLVVLGFILSRYVWKEGIKRYASSN